MVAAVDVVHSALSVGVPDPLLCRRVKRFPVLRIPFAQAVAIVMAVAALAARFIPCHGLTAALLHAPGPAASPSGRTASRRRIQTAPRVYRAPGRPAPAADTVRASCHRAGHTCCNHQFVFHFGSSVLIYFLLVSSLLRRKIVRIQLKADEIYFKFGCRDSAASATKEWITHLPLWLHVVPKYPPV